PFVLTAKTVKSLQLQAARLAAHLAGHPEQSLRDVAHSLATTRSAFEQRAVLLASERDQLLTALRSLAAGERPPLAAIGQAKVTGKLAFVFAGQGWQWQGMAQGLMQSSPVFAAQMQACAAAFDPLSVQPLFETLTSSDPALLDAVELIQPVLFAVMVSLAALWRSYGVEPDAVVG